MPCRNDVSGWLHVLCCRMYVPKVTTAADGCSSLTSCIEHHYVENEAQHHLNCHTNLQSNTLSQAARQLVEVAAGHSKNRDQCKGSDIVHALQH